MDLEGGKYWGNGINWVILFTQSKARVEDVCNTISLIMCQPTGFGGDRNNFAR